MVYELYRHSIPTALTTRHMMLQLFEKLVKSHFDVMDEGDPELGADWDDFIRFNVSSFYIVTIFEIVTCPLRGLGGGGGGGGSSSKFCRN